MIHNILIVFFLAISTQAFARVDCPIAKVEHVQIEHDYAHIKLEGQPWRHIGKISDIGTKERISLLMTAQVANRNVLIAYPDGYDCNKSTFEASMIVARLY